MAKSQLKRLKESLRDQGITGQQKSKKQKNAQRTQPSSEKIERSVALQRIRDSFNPFELRQAARPVKFAHVSAKDGPNGRTGRYKDVLHRPGVSRSAGEEMRRATLLPEMNRRNKTGGLIDRRIGEGDVDMTPQEKAAERFARTQQKKQSGASLFDLEASDDESGGYNLTHGGKSINNLAADDFKDDVSTGSGDEDLFSRKRSRTMDEHEHEGDEHDGETSEEPERKKSRKEVMEEVIAKSKLYKYERQKAKEEDEDLREELDKDLPDVLALLHGKSRPIPHAKEQTQSDGPVMNPDRQRLLEGLDRGKSDKEYDARLRQLAQDTRAKASERAKTEEEKATIEAERLKDLEDKRLRRMRGEDDDPDEEAEPKNVEKGAEHTAQGDEDFVDEAAEFGLNTARQDKVVLEDEDEFALDEDLIADGSDVDLSSSGESESDSDLNEDGDNHAEEEDDFVRGILGPTGSNATDLGSHASATSTAYTYPCPRSHDELLEVLAPVVVEKIPVVVQRIRALYHPSLSASNKEAMAAFSAVLVEHIAYMARQKRSSRTIEQLIRHLHSLSRSYPIEIAIAFRKQLTQLHDRNGGRPDAGDLIILTAIGSIYPTSDHFHQVVTPAITLIARFLGLTSPSSSVSASTVGAYLVSLGLSYQRLSRRYIPEAVRFTYRALSSKKQQQQQQQNDDTAVEHHLVNLVAMAELWRDKSAFVQIFEPFVPLLVRHKAKKQLQTLKILLQAARLRLRPLELHNHRPLAIRSNLPKFEEGFNPNKHYDPDKERSDAKKLQKEYQRERKGALRELRKDANFMAREQLREKKERDAAYEKKYRRLIAEIQGQEGHDAKEYEREKKARARASRKK